MFHNPRSTVAIGVGLAFLIIMPTVHAQGPEPAGASGPDALPVEIQALLGAANQPTDVDHMRRALGLQLAHQDGSLFARMAAGLPVSADEPREVEIICDVDGDQRMDFLVHDVVRIHPEIPESESTIRVLSGADGHQIWKMDNLDYIETPTDNAERLGAAPPRRAGNLLTSFDANEDGVCDIAAFGEMKSLAFENGHGVKVLAYNWTGRIHVLDGRTGKPLWTRPFHSDRTELSLPHELNADAAEGLVLLGFPTGFLVHGSDQGLRLVYKTTDVYFQKVHRPKFPGTPVNFTFERQAVLEHVHMLNASTGRQIWKRDLGDLHNDPWTRFSWITGVSDVAGTVEPEVLLDQYLIRNPRGTDPQSSDLPISNRTRTESLYKVGRGMDVLALRGEDGQDAWWTAVFRDSVVKPNFPREETYERLVWTHAQLLPDLSGDGRPDPVALYLAQDMGQGTSLEGRFVTHVHPIDGATGKKLFGDVDVRVQGWGYAASLSTEQASPLFAMATLDLPTKARPGGQMAGKTVRIQALSTRDGTVDWEYAERFSQESYLSYVLGLSQISNNLAAKDWDGDGVKDLLTPSQYRGPADEQLLLSTMMHDYQILSGRDGSVLREFSAWGANGVAIACPGDLANVETILSGHGRRLDLLRINVETNEVLTRQHAWLDPKVARAATAGFDLLGLDARCHRDAKGRILFAVTADLRSRQQYERFVATVGVIHADGTTEWQAPSFDVPNGIEAFLASSHHGPPPKKTLPWVAVGVGAVVGAALGILAALRWPRPRRLLVASAGLLLLGFLPIAGAAGLMNPLTPFVPSDVVAADAGVGQGAPPTALRDQGEPFPFAPPSGPESLAGPPEYKPTGSMDENATRTFSHIVEDIDGDTVQDLLMDTYCMAPTCGTSPRGLAPLHDFRSLVARCTAGHALTMISAADGRHLWNRSLDQESPWPGECTTDFVVGPARFKGGSQGILVYRLRSMDSWPVNQGAVVEHTLYMIDANDGKRLLWSRTFEGHLERTIPFAKTFIEIADTMVLHPILVAPRPNDPTRSANDEPTLLLQGVGWRRVEHEASVREPILIFGHPELVDGRFPLEWAARLDLETGAILWKTPTFDTMERSIEAFSDSRAPIRPWSGAEEKASDYWGTGPWCTDLNADGVAELVFLTNEWSATPTTNLNGPYVRTHRLLALDGKTGSKLFDSTIIRHSLDPKETLWLERMGDVNHDGRADLLLNWVVPEDHFQQRSFKHILSARSGADGDEIWRVESPRRVKAWPLGDASGDGANDLLTLAWFEQKTDAKVPYGLTALNVSRVPMRLVSGADGRELWNVSTIAAPVDIVRMQRMFEANGFPDLNRDGVGDFVVNEPVYLADLTVVNRQTAVSGRDGAPLFSYVSAGSFAFPLRAPDIDGDGADDLAVLNGDIADLWLTTYDGDQGRPLWSRRVFASNLASFRDVYPLLRLDAVRDGNGTRNLALNFQIKISVPSDFWQVEVSETGGASKTAGMSFSLVTYPRLALLDAGRGTQPWSHPAVYSDHENKTITGATRYSVILANALRPAPTPLTADGWVVLELMVSASPSCVATGLLVFFLVRRWVP